MYLATVSGVAEIKTDLADTDLEILGSTKG